MDPHDHKALVNVAIMHDKLGQKDLALQSLERAVVIKGSDRKIHANLGIINRKMGNFEKSETHLQNAISLTAAKQSHQSGVPEEKSKLKSLELLFINKLLVAQ